jgi:hypothetical protein
MNKIHAVYILCQLLIANCFAQGFNWQWARCTTGTPAAALQEGISVACNARSGAYITGYFSYTTTFGNDTMLTAGNSFFLARYDTAGNFSWVRADPSNTGADYSLGYGVATDAYGNAYLTGYFEGDSFYFGNVLLNGGTQGALFVTKYDTAGNVLWATAAAGAVGVAITTDLNSNVYVTGNYDISHLNIGDTVLINAGIANIFIAKYDSSGNFQWAQTAGGSSYDQGQAVTTDGAGNVYVAGYFSSDTINIGGRTIYNPGGNSLGFTAKFNTAGSLTWVAIGGGLNEYVRVYGVAADTSQNVYITGIFESPVVNFDTLTLSYNNSQGLPGFFLVKYNAMGQPLWGKSAAGNTEQFGYCVQTDAHNNVYVSGGFIFGSGVDTFIIDSDTLTAPITADPMFLLQINGQGNLVRAQSFSSGADDENWFALDGKGNGYLGGDFYSLPWLIFGMDTLIPTSSENMFIAKFGADTLVCNLRPPVITANTNTICANDSALICAPTGFNSYLWNTGQTTACFYTDLAGNYYVTVTDGHGCDATSNPIALTVNTPPQVSITVNHDTLSANNGSAFQWFLNGSPQPGDTTSQIIATKGGNYTVQITDSNGCSAISNPVNIAGIASLNNESISIYPNPSTGNWQLAVGNGQLATGNSLIGAAFEVWDNTGQIIYQSKITSVVTEINLPALASGVYFLRVNTGEGGW